MGAGQSTDAPDTVGAPEDEDSNSEDGGPPPLEEAEAEPST